MFCKRGKLVVLYQLGQEISTAQSEHVNFPLKCFNGMKLYGMNAISVYVGTFDITNLKFYFEIFRSPLERDNLIFSRIKKCSEFDMGIDPLTALFPKTFQLFKIVVSTPAFRYGNFDGGD